MKGNNRFNTSGRTAPHRGVTTAAIAATTLLFGAVAAAQVPVDEHGNPVGSEFEPVAGASVENPATSGDGSMTNAELESLVGPIALYPDDLLAIVLPASTYPLEVVQAARFLERVEADPSLEPDAAWDDSIVALLNYPDVLNMMNEDLDWTWQLGDAVVQQQGDVILAIESFRDRAYAAGNPETDERQVVSRNDDGVIEIEPVDDDVIYVPYYEPERVVYYSPAPVYHYYPRAYPVYYYPYPTGHYLTSGFFWGVTTAFTIGWATDHLHVYHHSYHGHPYYGHRYYYSGSYWRRPTINVYNTWYVDTRSPYYANRYRRGDYWRPREHRSGARPATRVVHKRYEGSRREQYRNRTRRTAGDYDFRERQSNRTAFDDRARRGVTADAERRDTDRRTRQGNTVAAGRIDQQRDRNAKRTGGSAARDDIRFRPRNNGIYTADRNGRLTTARSNAQRVPGATGRTDRTRVTASSQRERAAAGSRTRARSARNGDAAFAANASARQDASHRRVDVRREAARTPARRTASAGSRSHNVTRSAPKRSVAPPRTNRATIKRSAQSPRATSRRSSTNRARSQDKKRSRNRN